MQNNVRSMLEGALISGIFLVLMFTTIYTPLGIITAMALPVPFTIYAARNDLKKSMLVVAASGLLTIFIGALPSIFSALFAGLLGVVMGVLYRQGKSAFHVFVGGSLASLAFLLGSLVISYYVLNINPVTTIQEMMNQSIEMSRSIMEQIGPADEKQTAMLTDMVGMIGKMVPMLLILGSTQFALINHWFSRKVLQRLGTPVPSFPPFREWRWPRSIMYYYLVVLLGSIIVGAQGGDMWETLLLNIKPILDIMMMIQGLSFLFFFSHSKGWGKAIPITAIVLVFIFPPFPFILVLLGILDLGIDLRSKVSKK
ncbi:YybS family protein [Ammoniphilus sp. YIM 78166]|uniref:YybS family protein n=1 Tax=Ammoniphilus sp. YIM 78166 TaxID=1644106 RepID=UPI001430D250|nr:YybS family protein [Ammoniphilus sp. YIM 78166]